MSNGKVLDGYIIVQKFDKIKRKNEGSPFTNIITNDNLGTVLESGDPEILPGNQVYYMNKYDRVFMGGLEVYVMKRDNIFKLLPGGSDAEDTEK